MTLHELIKVLQIVAKYVDTTDCCQAEHHQLYLPLMNDTLITPEDEEQLLELGAFKSDSDCWAVYT